MTRHISQPTRTDQDGQALLPGVKAVTTKDRLQVLADRPLAPRKAQKPLDMGLFDEDARNQMDLL